jgi:predicted DNA-binding protein with PD1-like motif
MDRLKRGDTWLLRLARGEELASSILALAREEGIRSASVGGIGALADSEFGFYRLDRKEYERRLVPEIVELVSLQGNLVRVEGEPFLHAHALCMRSDFTMTGGHFFRGTVAVTCEVWVREFGAEVTREMDAEIGLRLLRFPGSPQAPIGASGPDRPRGDGT